MTARASNNLGVQSVVGPGHSSEVQFVAHIFQLGQAYLSVGLLLHVFYRL